ncbi:MULTISPECIES: MT-A70 family methyltransferase [Methylobacterium]|uniref:MT-A70 family methyltransferase n=1 Tax=Methylobacterium TaxID=407 RepID=UPI0009FF5077|nr:MULTISPECIES: MT-A70 family methyltransferase [Methylobacterium]MDH3027621.1 MT-A70 family methyltransferase [Methylobacterium fujisawaense]
MAEEPSVGPCDEGALNFAGLPRSHFQAVVIDPPWRFSGGTRSRPQHYRRMSLAEVQALPVRGLLHPDGGRVFLWITAPLLHRIPEIAKAWKLRYSSAIPWIKLWPSESGLFVYASSVSRGTGFEVIGAAEYVAILKAGRPHSIKGRPFSGVWIEPRREHSRKPPNLHREIEARIPGPYLELFARESRPGWCAWGDEATKFDPAPTLAAAE